MSIFSMLFYDFPYFTSLPNLKAVLNVSRKTELLHHYCYYQHPQHRLRQSILNTTDKL